MNATRTTGGAPGRAADVAANTRLPGTTLAAIRFELLGYFRSTETVFFTFLFPVLLLGIFGTAFSGMGEIGTLPDGTGGISMSTYYLPGMVAAGVFLSGVQNLAIDVAREKYDGWLRRLGATPFRPTEYFLGKAGATLITSLAQTALLVLFAVVVLGVQLPTEPERWLTFAWIYLLGIICMSLLGIALSSVARSNRSSSAVVLPPVLLLQFISGVYLQFSMLPEWLQNVASVFPLKWLAQGMRSVFLPEHFAELETGGAWQLGLVATMLGVWIVVGLVCSLLTFRWQRRS